VVRLPLSALGLGSRSIGPGILGKYAGSFGCVRVAVNASYATPETGHPDEFRRPRRVVSISLKCSE
jgi:hypothetical protein